MPKIDKKNGRITTDDGVLGLEFKGSKIIYRESSVEVSVPYEVLGDGTKLAIFNDLELRGMSGSESAKIIGKMSELLEGVGFSVEIS